MQEVCGIIVEWNPFHNGHRAILQAIRSHHPQAVVIALMSGNYVQRGEVAILSKWERAKMGVKYGADLVFELPFWQAVQPADGFSRGGVEALAALGVQTLVFGSEVADFKPYQVLADWLANHQKQVEGAWQERKGPRGDFARDRLQFLYDLCQKEEELKELTIDFQNRSNTLLAFRYAKANADLHSSMRLEAFKREKHYDFLSEGVELLSSSQIRHSLSQHLPASSLGESLPREMAEALDQTPRLGFLASCYPYLRYTLLTHTRPQLARYYQVYEGIEGVLQEAAKTCDTYEDFLEKVVNKRWTRYRIERALVMVLLQVEEEEMVCFQNLRQPLVLLGATKRGRSYLKDLKKQSHSRYSILSRIGQAEEKQWPLAVRADQFYQQFVMKSDQSQVFGRTPYLRD